MAQTYRECAHANLLSSDQYGNTEEQQQLKQRSRGEAANREQYDQNDSKECADRRAVKQRSPAAKP